MKYIEEHSDLRRGQRILQVRYYCVLLLRMYQRTIFIMCSTVPAKDRRPLPGCFSATCKVK